MLKGTFALFRGHPRKFCMIYGRPKSSQLKAAGSAHLSRKSLKVTRPIDPIIHQVDCKKHRLGIFNSHRPISLSRFRAFPEEKEENREEPLPIRSFVACILIFLR